MKVLRMDNACIVANVSTKTQDLLTMSKKFTKCKLDIKITSESLANECKHCGKMYHLSNNRMYHESICKAKLPVVIRFTKREERKQL